MIPCCYALMSLPCADVTCIKLGTSIYRDSRSMLPIAPTLRQVLFRHSHRDRVGTPHRHEGNVMINPEQAREKMLSPRARAARAVEDQIESFIDEGNEHNVIVMSFASLDENAVIAELLEYKKIGWRVEFYKGCAAIALPEVLS